MSEKNKDKQTSKEQEDKSKEILLSREEQKDIIELTSKSRQSGIALTATLITLSVLALKTILESDSLTERNFLIFFRCGGIFFITTILGSILTQYTHYRASEISTKTFLFLLVKEKLPDIITPEFYSKTIKTYNKELKDTLDMQNRWVSGATILFFIGATMLTFSLF